MMLAETVDPTGTGGLWFVPWIPLFVAVVVAFGTIGASWWNTRGESTSLRRLKAMNEALEGIPADRAAHASMLSARDKLAERVAGDILQPRNWTGWATGVAMGVGVLALLLPLLNPELTGGGTNTAEPAATGIVFLIATGVVGVFSILAIGADFWQRRGR